jgi:dipeptidyl aminopeptidase/acylaminoacyl peptidase
MAHSRLDGTRIAGKFGIGGTQVIGIRNLFDTTEKPVQLAVPDQTEADWVHWVGNDYVLVKLRALVPLGQGDRGYVTRLIAIERATGKVTRILWNLEGQNASDVLWTARDGAPEILVSAQHSMYLDEGFFPTVHRINLATGRGREVQSARDGVMDWQADGNGVVRSGVSYTKSGRLAQLVYRGADPDQPLRTIDKANSKAHEALLDPLLFEPGTDNAIATFTSDEGRDQLFEVNMLTQQTGRMLFEAPAGTEIDHVVMSQDRSAVLGVATSDAPSRVHWLDPDMAEIQAAFDKSVAKQGVTVEISSLSADRSAMLVTLARPDSPGALYYFSVANGTMQRIAVFNDQLKQVPVSPVKTVRYKARDGLEIEAVMTVPKGREAHDLPVVMLPHGGPWAQDVASWDYLAQYIASRGYLVIQPISAVQPAMAPHSAARARGRWAWPCRTTFPTGWPGPLRKAWLIPSAPASLVRRMAAMPRCGGWPRIRALSVRRLDFRRASLRREVNDFGGFYMQGKLSDDWKEMTPDFAAVSRSTRWTDRCAALLIHGRKDVTVAVGQSDAMASRMRAAGKTVDYVSLPKADHYFTRLEDRKAMLDAIGAWLAKYNPS